MAKRTPSKRLALSNDVIPIAKVIPDNSSKTVNDKRLYQQQAGYRPINSSKGKNKRFRKLTGLGTSSILY